jgi:hypothetical protein
MKEQTIARAGSLAKASAKVIEIRKAQAKARLKAIGIGGGVMLLAFGFVVTGTTEAIAPTKAQALVVEAQKNEATLKKYENANALTDQELVELLSAVGFEGQDLKEAWAIAKKESNGRPLAHNGNTNTGDNSYGVFQVNMLGELGVDRREQFGLKSNSDLLNPVVNAQIAYYMSKGGENWTAWKGTNTPKVKQWMSKFPAKQ